MLIYLLRHGDALPADQLHDSERPLSDLGKHQARGIASYCSRHGIIVQAIYASPFVRAQETAEPLRMLHRQAEFITTEFLVPTTRPDPLFDLLNERRFDAVALIGHEPTMSTLTSLLVSGDTDFKVDFQKGTLALIESPSPIRKGRALLKWVLPVEHLLH